MRRRSSWSTRIVAASAVLILLLNDYQTRLTAVNHTISNRTKTHTHLQTRIHMPASFIHTQAKLTHNTHTHVLARGRTLLRMRRSLTLLPYFRLFLFQALNLCTRFIQSKCVTNNNFSNYWLRKTCKWSRISIPRRHKTQEVTHTYRTRVAWWISI